MPLALVNEGARAVLRSIQGGRSLRGRLAALGLIPGTEITVLRNGGGPFVVAVNNARICIGRGMAMKIEVD